MADALKAYEAEPYSYSEVRALSEQLKLSEPVAVTLVRRGYRTPEDARAFLAADESHPPGAFRSMQAVVDVVSTAVRESKRITVHGDFDVDGVCATTIMVSTLRELGAECDWLIPDRIADGYGLCAENVQLLAERGTELLITVDCGITSVDEIALAKSLGMEVVVTDHHQPGDTLPDCLILHPAVDGYPFEELCGTAVAWKLASALREASGGTPPETVAQPIVGVGSNVVSGVSGGVPPDALGNADLDLVALATVADVVPLVGENRSLVRRGLEEVRRARRPGMRALLEAAKCEPTQLDEGDLAFRLAPRINAAGRLYRADAGVELFLTDDEARAAEIANELSRANGERRATEREVDTAAEAARRELSDELREAPGLVLAGEGWHPGVIGIVASRLVERHHRPVIVISLDGEGNGRGSGRSIPGFDLLAGLEACAEHLDGFGGHRAAAGLQLRAENVEPFQAAFAAHASSVLGPDDLKRTERIDAMVGGAGLGLDLAEELQQLAPFGMGNPGVRLLVPSARVRDVRAMGEGKHARFSLHSGAHRALGVAFGRASLGVGEDDPVDAAVRLEVNRWNGSIEPRVVLRELYPRETAAAEAADEAWWQRFERELAADPTRLIVPPERRRGLDRIPTQTSTAPDAREVVRSRSSAAAVVGELASSGAGEVLALVACVERRVALAGDGAVLADAAVLEAEPDLATRFEHVVFVDPPQFPHVEELAMRGEGYAHLAWGEAEHRFALSMLDVQLARREILIGMFRDLREADGASGEELLEALRGSGRFPRPPEAAARCLLVLSELGLVQGAPAGGGGSIGVVSSEGTELERSAAYRAYGARHQEGQRFLERRKSP
ncbi:MAG TPA: single-stranded-DNA-specific exonuclease RecJ [Solirubrobacterales bacterium]|nr:single-stranded-DNA-specific exonuclease RecJ [Solirubrobacterales bacterium]